MTNQKEKDDLESVFKSLDKIGNGNLSKSKLTDASGSLGLSHLLDVDEIMKSCSTDARGNINYHDFINAASNWSKNTQREQLKTAYELYESGIEGNFSVQELKDCIPGIENTE